MEEVLNYNNLKYNISQKDIHITNLMKAIILCHDI
jgi:hypothetical protein